MRDAAYPYKEIEESGYVYPIIDLGIQFYEPLHYDDPIRIHTRPAELERVKLRFDYIITHGETGADVCKGFTKHCALNARGRPVAVDPKTVQLWKTFPGPSKRSHPGGHARRLLPRRSSDLPGRRSCRPSRPCRS